MPETNQVKFVGIRRVSPEEGIPVYHKRKEGTTQIVKSKAVDNGYATVHTVTAGKTFFLSTLVHTVTPTVAGSSYVTVRNAASVLQYAFTYCQTPAGHSENLAIPFNPPIEIPAGFYIDVFSSAANHTANVFISGWE